MQSTPAGGREDGAALKVGVISRFFWHSGGAEAFALSLLRMLGRTRHDTTLYTLQPPREAPEGVRVAVPSRWRRRPTPPLLRRYTVLHTDYKPLFSMARDSDVAVVSDWDIFMKKTAAKRILFYFHSQLAPAGISDADPGGGAPAGYIAARRRSFSDARPQGPHQVAPPSRALHVLGRSKDRPGSQLGVHGAQGGEGQGAGAAYAA